MYQTILLISYILQCIMTDGMLKINSNRMISEGDCRENYEYLKSNYSKNKILLKEIELASLVALSYFPELKNIEIEFVLKDIATTMETRPKFNYSLSFNKGRQYIIYVDNKVKFNNGILIDQIPFNALLGLIGHELAHVVDYENKGMFNLLSLLFKYNDLEFREEFEKNIDLQTVNKGLAWQLYDWANYAMCESNASERYKNFKMTFYLEPDEIETIIFKN